MGPRARPCPHSLHSCHQKCGRRSSLPFSGDVFATAERAGGSPAQSSVPYLDDDIPLLNVDEEPGDNALLTASPRAALTLRVPD